MVGLVANNRPIFFLAQNSLKRFQCKAFQAIFHPFREYPDGTIPALAAVQMMITNPGVYWRTEQEYKDLFAASRFKLEQLVYTDKSLTMMEFSLQ
ncbi:hypothetical protein [Moorena sp. SIO3H5]|uniref:hypothetical protein n=1 Tax=Moorena sp. SIO3H5 TaxID=2607834 RepID=UPI0025D2ADD5|nr:hypothetical protein [Moorena sp. SIO3H5]